jgi:hypothetical protein
MGTCASDQQVKKITNFSQRSFPDISRIISELVRNSKIAEFKTALPNLEVLNDFTNSGAINILKRFQQVGEKSLFREGRIPLHLLFRLCIVLRAKPEQLCPVEFCAGSPLPDGHVDLNSVLSGYTNSGSALVRTFSIRPMERRST